MLVCTYNFQFYALMVGYVQLCTFVLMYNIIRTQYFYESLWPHNLIGTPKSDSCVGCSDQQVRYRYITAISANPLVQHGLTSMVQYGKCIREARTGL